MDFDTRAAILKPSIEPHWDDQAKEAIKSRWASVRQSLIPEFGERDIDTKLDSFAEIGTKPVSVLSYHNDFFHQVRQAYVLGACYPALVGACALGERILNHLIQDLRQFYVRTPRYKHVSRKDSFNDWSTPIDTLEDWEVLLPAAVIEFRALMQLRHRSIHFNITTYDTVKGDALAAILHMRSIIEHQFGSFSAAPWFISGTIGHAFIKKEFENNAFVRTYFLPKCPFVGPLFGMALTKDGWEIYDRKSYGKGAWTDEEFARQYNERDPEKVVHSIC